VTLPLGYLTVSAAAKHLNVSRQTLYDWHQRYNLPFTMVGRTTAVAIHQLDMWRRDFKTPKIGAPPGKRTVVRPLPERPSVQQVRSTMQADTDRLWTLTMLCTATGLSSTYSVRYALRCLLTAGEIVRTDGRGATGQHRYVYQYRGNTNGKDN
jgi:excisionase family DNA binding protein